MEIIVVSHLNCDGYEVDGKFYYFGEADKVAERIDLDDDVVWVKGRNVFTGNLVSDRFFETMKDNVYKAFRKQFEN